MKLHYWQGDGSGIRNYGDELNPWLWQHALPGILDDDPRTIFVGCGSILNDTIPPASKTVVMGAGIGYGRPARIDETWRFYAVRGPLTARMLGLLDAIGISDPGILVGNYFPFQNIPKKYEVGYIPHWHNAHSGMREVCSDLGYLFVNPLDDVETVMRAIASCELILAEAMHGAITAEAFRIPWIPVSAPFPDQNQFKWLDLCETLDVEYHPHLHRAYWSPRAKPHGLLDRARNVYKAVKRAHVRRRIQTIAETIAPTLSRNSRFDSLKQRYAETFLRFRHDVAGKFYH